MGSIQPEMHGLVDDIVLVGAAVVANHKVVVVDVV